MRPGRGYHRAHHQHNHRHNRNDPYRHAKADRGAGASGQKTATAHCKASKISKSHVICPYEKKGQHPHMNDQSRAMHRCCQWEPMDLKKGDVALQATGL